MAKPRQQAKQRIQAVLEERNVPYADTAAEAVVSELEKLAAEQEGFQRPEPQLPGQTSIYDVLDNETESE